MEIKKSPQSLCDGTMVERIYKKDYGKPFSWNDISGDWTFPDIGIIRIWELKVFPIHHMRVNHN